MVIRAKARPWGNSVGMIIPSDTVKELSIAPGDELVVEIKKKENPLQELWGSLSAPKNWRAEFKAHRKELEGHFI